jgi:hypothetical protein
MARSTRPRTARATRTRIAGVALTTPVVAAALALGAPAAPAGAATFTVTDPSDNAATPNTLRWAVAQASADPDAPVIEIEPGLDIDLTCAGGGALAYANAANHPLTIVGHGATVTQTCAASAVLSSADEDLAVHGLEVRGGSAGGIVSGGDVVVESSTIEGNVGGAGVVAYTGTATIVRSTLHRNMGSAGGGVAAINVVIDQSTLVGNGATNGGGAWSDQWMIVTNSTITGNEASVSGGGVYAGLDAIDLAHATVVANIAPVGANLDLDSASGLTSFASILAAPLGGGSSCQLALGANIATAGGNISSDTSCGFGPDDLTGTDPELGALADNGGPTLTMLPVSSGPAVDRADCAGPFVVDQRDVARPQGSRCDAGAVELEAAAIDEPGEEPTGPDPDPIVPAGPSGPATPVRITPRFTG